VEVELHEETQDKDIHGKTLHGNMLNILPISGRGNANLFRRADSESVGALLRNLHSNFNDVFEVDIIDPRCLLWFFDFVNYKVRTTEPTWVLDGKSYTEASPPGKYLNKYCMKPAETPSKMQLRQNRH